MISITLTSNSCFYMAKFARIYSVYLAPRMVYQFFVVEKYNLVQRDRYDKSQMKIIARYVDSLQQSNLVSCQYRYMYMLRLFIVFKIGH